MSRVEVSPSVYITYPDLTGITHTGTDVNPYPYTITTTQPTNEWTTWTVALQQIKGKQIDIFIGVDPGADGGLAVATEAGNLIFIKSTKNLLLQEKKELIRDICRVFDPNYIHVAIEKALLSIPRGKKNSPNANAAGKLGKNQGEWVGLFTALLNTESSEVVEVHPGTWKKLVKDQPGPDLKKKAEAYAKSLYPTLVVGPQGGYKSGLGDALCITMWLRNRYLETKTEQEAKLPK